MKDSTIAVRINEKEKEQIKALAQKKDIPLS